MLLKTVNPLQHKGLTVFSFRFVSFDFMPFQAISWALLEDLLE
jgi:hypothetical protein